MAALINFNGTICCTNMDKHAKHPSPKTLRGTNAPQAQARPAVMPLPLEQELEQITRLLHEVQPPLNLKEQELLLSLARHMQSIVDSRTCALRSDAFVGQLETEMHRVRRGRSELALACFSLHGQDDIASLHGPDAVPEAFQALVYCLKNSMLPCDSIGCTPSGHHALILPGVGGFKAQVYVEKILKDCAAQGVHSAHGAFVPHFMAGIACATATNAQVDTLLQEALSALHSAADSPNFCAVYRNTGSTGLYQTLVHSKEKRFLFSGGQ